VGDRRRSFSGRKAAGSGPTTAYCSGFYDDDQIRDQIRVALQPAIAGASMPSMLDIRGTEAVTLFTMHWYAYAGDGRTEVLTYRPGNWEDALRRGCWWWLYSHDSRVTSPAERAIAPVGEELPRHSGRTRHGSRLLRSARRERSEGGSHAETPMSAFYLTATDWLTCPRGPKQCERFSLTSV
jgi:hypothetical protein